MELKRLYRLRDAPTYLGMDKNRFNAEVRPYLTEIPIGSHGIAFDRVDLDMWADHYKRRNGRPARLEGEELWGESERQDSPSEAGSGTSISRSGVTVGFVKALELVRSPGPKNTSGRGSRKSAGSR